MFTLSSVTPLPLPKSMTTFMWKASAPFYRRIADNRRIKAFVDGVTAAAAGAIAGAAIVLARRAIVDVPAIIVAIATLAVITWMKKLPEPLVIVIAGGVGLMLWSAR